MRSWISMQLLAAFHHHKEAAMVIWKWSIFSGLARWISLSFYSSSASSQGQAGKIKEKSVINSFFWA